MDWMIAGGTVLRDGAMVEDALPLAGGVVAEAADGSGARFDASGLLVLPGLVDIHGDAHERQLQPRPGVDLPVGLALRDSAAQLVACGITTAYLGVTLSWEPGLRSLDAWRALKAALPAARAQAATDLRVHLRFEADNLDALEDALGGIADGSVHLLGFNDHTPAIVRKLGDPVQMAKYAGRAGMKAEAFRTLAEAVMARRGEVPAARARLADAARQAGIPVLSHDDATLEDRAHYRAHGATICEFPMAEAVAVSARAAGEHVVMGAPNVVRGGSHLGWHSAEAMVRAGAADVLASDYYYPAMRHAAFALAARGACSLPAAWALVSANAAAAVALSDRGRIAPGLRADLVLLDDSAPGGAEVVATIVGGRIVWVSGRGAALLA